MDGKKGMCESDFQTENTGTFPVGTKGVPIGRQQHGCFSLKDEHVSLPCAVVRQGAIESNVQWMQSFAQHHHVKLCPHGKTTMSPDLFKQQLEQGAWGLTVATPAQAEVAVMAGANNIIIANQVVGKVNMQMVATLIQQHQIMVYACVDSLSNVQSWQAIASQEQVSIPLFIELGVPDGRCGCRDVDDVLELAAAIEAAPNLSLRGIEVYEGVISGESAEQDIRQFLRRAISLLETLKSTYGLQEAIVSGAGSAWYDVVAEEFSQLDGITGVIRPGCYAVHDTGIYEAAQSQVQARAITNQGIACDLSGDLVSSLEVWAYVVSVPEEGKAVVGVGKRDVAFDAGLPTVERLIREGEEQPLPALTATKVMDQHMFVEAPNGGLKVGDILVMSTSHPCLTFDKWRFIGVIDEQDCVTHWMQTYF
ncbi:alanine racemase [Enterovibrio calviensis]|uniref:alanine racemase n=1 Tax=Enterovibrio calviensis TaxID=91359 RepID=UPI00048967E7|nr:alanine racemase [Enterovibrio calviensis]